MPGQGAQGGGSQLLIHSFRNRPAELQGPSAENFQFNVAELDA